MNKRILRKADIFFENELAGYLSETEDGYIFQYNKDFIKKNIPISLSLPIQEEPYESDELFSFFKGLLPEGWYLDIVCATQKVDKKDFLGILISTASADTIGSVTVRKVK